MQTMARPWMFYTSIPAEWGGVMVSEKVTQETYYRLLMMDYMPQEVERLLYLDTDIIVKGDISEFYGMPIDTEFAAVCEDPCYIKPNPIKESVFSKLSFSDSDHYFNAGVILFNLRRIREKFSTDDFLDFAINRQDIITYHDQDVLNYLFKGHVRWVPECYNCRICMYPNETRDRVLEEARIVHYGPKPWQPEYGRVFASEIFWENAREIGYYWKWLAYLARRDMVRARNKAVRMIKGRKG